MEEYEWDTPHYFKVCAKNGDKWVSSNFGNLYAHPSLILNYELDKITKPVIHGSYLYLFSNAQAALSFGKKAIPYHKLGFFECKSALPTEYMSYRASVDMESIYEFWELDLYYRRGKSLSFKVQSAPAFTYGSPAVMPVRFFTYRELEVLINGS